MKYTMLLAGCLVAGTCIGQKNIPATDSILITGEIKMTKTLTLDDLQTFPITSIPDLIILSHTGALKDTLRALKGVLLQSVLEDVELMSDSPKLNSEFYVELIASDGYKVVYSWNELFNSETGYHVYLLMEKQGKTIATMADRIAVICTSDFMTGRRYVQGLERIVFKRTK